MIFWSDPRPKLTAMPLPRVLRAASWLTLTLLNPASLPSASGQSPQTPATQQQPQALAFDSVSIRPSAADAKVDFGISKNGFDATGLPLLNTLFPAWLPLSESFYRPDRLAAAPAWLVSDNYDVHARFDAATSATLRALPSKQRDEQVKTMLRMMLAERCRLKLQVTEAEADVTWLRVAHGGAKLAAAPPNEKPPADRGIDLGDGAFESFSRDANGVRLVHLFHISMPLLAIVLSGYEMEKAPPILDGTGLQGVYDLSLRQISADASGSEGYEPAPPTRWDVTSYGLTLKYGRGPLPLLRILHIEQPSEN